jgi:hypothetical protein
MLGEAASADRGEAAAAVDGKSIVKPRRGSRGNERHHNSVRAEPKESRHGLPKVSDARSSGHQVPEKSEAPKDYKTALRSYRFQRAAAPGIIEVLNENSYVMAQYSERTGSVKWQRLVLASQREQIEKWLDEHYPRV